MTQLVECLRHMEEVRGSSPLLPTTNGAVTSWQRLATAPFIIYFKIHIQIKPDHKKNFSGCRFAYIYFFA